MVATRSDRPVRLPDVLLLDGARLLADGVEVHQVVPLKAGMDAAQVLDFRPRFLGHGGGRDLADGMETKSAFDGWAAAAQVGAEIPTTPGQ